MIPAAGVYASTYRGAASVVSVSLGTLDPHCTPLARDRSPAGSFRSVEHIATRPAIVGSSSVQLTLDFCCFEKSIARGRASRTRSFRKKKNFVWGSWSQATRARGRGRGRWAARRVAGGGAAGRRDWGVAARSDGVLPFTRRRPAPRTAGTGRVNGSHAGCAVRARRGRHGGSVSAAPSAGQNPLPPRHASQR